MSFTRDAISLTTGQEQKFKDKHNMFFILRDEFAEWKDTIDDSGISCKCINNLTIRASVCLCSHSALKYSKGFLLDQSEDVLSKVIDVALHHQYTFV